MVTLATNLFDPIKTIAIIGAKDKPQSDVNRVGRYLLEQGFKVIPVHPTRTNVWGLQTFTHLTAIKEPVHMVNVFRAPLYCFDHAKEACALSPLPRVFWMQLGIQNEQATALLQQHKMMVIDDRCIMVHHTQMCNQKNVPHGTFGLPSFQGKK